MLDFIRFLRWLNWKTFQRTFALTVEKRLTGLAAEMAFNAMLGLFPAIIAVLTAMSLFENSIDQTLGDLAIHLAGIIPQQVWNLILNFTEDVKVSQGKSWFSLSFVATIWVISGVIGSASNALDNINQVPARAKKPFWHTKLVAILLTIGTIILLFIASFLLLIGDFLLELALQQNWSQLLLLTWQIFSVIVTISIVVTALLILIQVNNNNTKKKSKKYHGSLSGFIIIISTILIQIVYFFFVIVKKLIVESNVEVTVSNLLISIWRLLSLPMALAVVAIAFAFIYQFGTSIRAKETPLIPGAILAAISWAIVSLLFRVYVTHFGAYNRIYGALGTVIVLMLWLYLSSLVMLLGDQLNVVVGEAIQQNSRPKNKSDR
ncbi:MAG TPA: YihY/virulence factor BrkB family protein [Xenococcaceae cyanobacterium]